MEAQMQVRKILGGIVNDQINHSIAKLENGCFAVGRLAAGQKIPLNSQFITLNAAYDHWFLTLPANSRGMRLTGFAHSLLCAAQKRCTKRAASDRQIVLPL